MQESTGNSIQPEVKLLAVIVVFKIRPAVSSSLLTLLDAARQAANSKLKLAVLIQDNTPGGQEAGDLPEDVRYQAAPHNPGLAQAYNSALKIAEMEGYDWLLTLDQDTSLPKNFLERISEIVATEGAAHPEVGAIVPLAIDDGRILSPYRLLAGALPCWYSAGSTGVVHHAMYAINSAATLRISALRKVGGYDPFFPLDMSDINLCHKLHKAGIQTFVAADLVIHHELALLDKRGRMTPERYRVGLLDECAFYDLEMGFLGRLERLIRLVGRIWKDRLEPDLLPFRTITLNEIKRRILIPRSKRITAWRAWAEARASGTQSVSLPTIEAVAIAVHRND
jgi:glycosyltransferase involved in cell wall biosynthesis